MSYVILVYVGSGMVAWGFLRSMCLIDHLGFEIPGPMVIMGLRALPAWSQGHRAQYTWKILKAPVIAMMGDMMQERRQLRRHWMC